MKRLNEPTQRKIYHTVLRELMIFVNDVQYAKDHEFQMAQLAELTPAGYLQVDVHEMFHEPRSWT
jgi:pentose-5-phosphate-3-epimerase